MKMKIPLESDYAGVVKAILVQAGDAVAEAGWSSNSNH
ncbi:biotin/lipoyl-containing protein [Cupriavidus sp. M-11]